MNTCGKPADRPALWQWPNIVSLDAALIAVAWQMLLSREMAAGLGRAHGVVLGASVWLAFTGDRWLDGWRLPANSRQTARHAFHLRHRWPLLAVWLAVLAVDVTVALSALTGRELALGCGLTAASIGYTVAAQRAAGNWRRLFPKEHAAAAIYAGGVVLFLIGKSLLAIDTPDVSGGVLRLPSAFRFPLVLTGAWAGMGALVYANCALIAGWEHALDAARAETSLAAGNPRRAFRRAGWAAVVGLGFSVLLAICGGPGWFALATALSGVGLLVLARPLSPEKSPEGARVLADLVLLAPAGLLLVVAAALGWLG